MTTRTKIGTALILVGLAGFIAMMTSIVLIYDKTGAKPSLEQAIATFSCWAVFFVGKTMIKVHGAVIPDA